MKKKLLILHKLHFQLMIQKILVEVLKINFQNIREPVKEDICYATTNRQAAVKKIAKDCDMFFIIGSKKFIKFIKT